MISETKKLKAELFDAGELLDRVTAERDQLKAENERLRKVAIELRDWASCEHVGHHKGEYHEFDEQCKVLARIDAVMAIGNEKSQGISRRSRDAIVEAMSKEG